MAAQVTHVLAQEMADAKNDAMSRMTAELKMLRDEHNAALVKQNAAEQTVKEADARAQKWALVAESACAEASKRAEDATHEARNLVTQLLDAKKEVSRLQVPTSLPVVSRHRLRWTVNEHWSMRLRTGLKTQHIRLYIAFCQWRL